MYPLPTFRINKQLCTNNQLLSDNIDKPNNQLQYYQTNKKYVQ